MARELAAADAHCRARGAQLTALRREVLELLLLREGSAKAYDLQDDMRARHGRVAPTTVYRALEFLIEQELVHRVDAINAFVVCNGEHVHHHAMMLVCAQCGQVTEWHDEEAFAALGKRLRKSVAGFHVGSVEIKGLCTNCTEAQAG
nr:transcriptional repressor [Caldimonas mangrovi]